MSPRPPFPELPQLPPSPINPIRNIIKQSHEQIGKAGEDIRSIADDIRGGVITTPPSETKNPVKEGTACLPCSRDHLSVTSSALSEGMRFAREKGVRDPEVVRRIRIALDELNIMERIDLAPEETAQLKGAEKELADWTLQQSRDLRHAITSIKDVEAMEQTAARASQTAEGFMDRLFSIPSGECETCNELRGKLSEFIERRRQEKG
jgi:hypothetical protein